MRAIRYSLIGLLLAAAMAASVALVVRNLPDGAPAPADEAAPAPSIAAAPQAPPAAPERSTMQGRAVEMLAVPPAGTIEPAPPPQAGIPAPSRLSFSSAQEDKVRYVLLSHNIMQTEAPDFPLQLGGAVPETVQLFPLPVEVADVVPNYRAYSYVISQNRIVIVVTDRRTIGSLIAL